jgi:hypothetical protein
MKFPPEASYQSWVILSTGEESRLRRGPETDDEIHRKMTGLLTAALKKRADDLSCLRRWHDRDDLGLEEIAPAQHPFLN